MKYLVYDVAASESGALSVLNDFYQEVLESNQSDDWIFVVSTPNFIDKGNIKTLKYPWVKKSWLHRLYFEYFCLNKIIKNMQIDRIVSLQNNTIPFTKIKQYVYMHNSIPFVDYKFKFFDNKILWVYQNVISKMIYKSLRKADYIIVQANWIKNRIVKKLAIDENKIDVVAPSIKIDIEQFCDRNNPEIYKTFFYPATGYNYKNHMCIINALKLIPTEKLKELKVYFTLSEKENNYTTEIYEIVKENNLPVFFVGKLKRKDVFELYRNSTLIFPSFVESSPLPLSEAMLSKSYVFSADLDYAHDVLGEYENVVYFNPNSAEKLAHLIVNFNQDMFKTLNNHKIKNNAKLLDVILYREKS